ncbi:MAG: cysteine desulfurase-like protein, partial [Planctomycetaceae bacterium]|nr:cysteine desulfurase-like protein [Planctomycetaceae bacterium]
QIAYFDGPAGSQCPQAVIDAVAEYLATHNANRGAPHATSRETDGLMAEAHRAAADFLGAVDEHEIVFGPNMTSLTFALSRALRRTWRSGDEVIVSRLDHDANVTPWVLAAESVGAEVRYIDVRLDDCTLDMDSFEAALSERTKLVAVGYASNVTGTINPVREIAARASSVGARCFVDAVHYAPHGRIDVRDIGCDFLVCSAYKFFGPHVGLLCGDTELLQSLPVEKLRPAPSGSPDRWMTGTQNHEGIAGTLACIDYLAGIGCSMTGAQPARREALGVAFESIHQYETALVRPLLEFLAGRRGVRVWGITDPARRHERVPTVSITCDRQTPQELNRALAAEGLWTWAGNHYAVPFTEAAGLEPNGTLRIGLLHYNTADEVRRLIEALDRLLD